MHIRSLLWSFSLFFSFIDLIDRRDLDSGECIISASNAISWRKKADSYATAWQLVRGATIFPDVQHLRKRAEHLFAAIVEAPPASNGERNLTQLTTGRNSEEITDAPVCTDEDAPASGVSSAAGSRARCPSHPCQDPECTFLADIQVSRFDYLSLGTRFWILWKGR